MSQIYITHLPYLFPYDTKTECKNILSYVTIVSKNCKLQ